MLVGAMDVSGNPDVGNYRFMGIVIGVKENLNAITRGLQLNELSAAAVKNNKIRSNLSSKLKFNGIENIGFCIRLDRDEIIDNIKDRVHSSRHVAAYRRYNHLLFQFMHERVSQFATSHGVELSKIIFQHDADCQAFIKDNNLIPCKKEYIHILADLVAWSNNNGEEPKGVIPLDSRSWIRKRLNKI